MKYGLSRKQLDEIIRIIADFTDVEEAVLFGSRVIDTFKEASDVDIAIKGEKVSASLAAKLRYQLEEETYLPFFFDFIAWQTITNDELKKHIRDKGVVIYRKGLSEWKECELQKIAEVKTGPFGSQLKNEQYITGGTPVVTVEHINNFQIIDFDYPSVTNEDKNRLSKYLLKTGDIIFTRVGSVDLSAFVKSHQDGWMFSSRMLRVRSNQEVDSRFLSYFFQQKRFREYILNISVGATMPSINTEILKGIPISYPPLSEQKAIASVLSSLDDKIDLLHRQNKTLETMAETLFRQWFVEEAKEDWVDGQLGEVLELVYGKGLKKEIRTGKGYPVVGSSGVVGHHSGFLVDGPGIVIGRKGTLGKVIYIFENFFPIDTTYYIKSKVNSVGLFYEYFLLKSLNFEDMNSDSAVPGLNRDIALSTEIKIAPLEKLKEFNQYSSTFLEKLNANNNQIRILEKLRDTLLPKLMRREVRVEYGN